MSHVSYDINQLWVMSHTIRISSESCLTWYESVLSHVSYNMNQLWVSHFAQWMSHVSGFSQWISDVNYSRFTPWMNSHQSLINYSLSETTESVISLNERAMPCHATNKPSPYIHIHPYIYIYIPIYIYDDECAMIQPIPDRVAQNLEIISKTFPTNQNSAHGIYG